MSDILVELEKFVESRSSVYELWGDAIRVLVGRARAEGASWQKIADVLGITRQGAQYLYAKEQDV